MSYLVRLGPPAFGSTIHRNDCRVLAQAKSPALRWQWADKHPDVDWKVTAPWLKACRICEPPSPAGLGD